MGASKQLKMALTNLSPLVVEFQTKFFFKIWSILMRYIDSSAHLTHYKHDFLAETYFLEKVATYAHSIKLRRAWPTLQH